MTKRISLYTLLITLLLAVVAQPVTASFEGEIESDLVLTPNDTSVFDESSSMDLTIDYVDGPIEDLPSLISQVLFWPNTTLVDTGLALRGSYDLPLFDGDQAKLLLDGYYASEFGPDYPIGTAGGSTRVSLGEDELNYWVTKGIVNYGGFSYRATFLLEKKPEIPPAIGPSPNGTSNGTESEGYGSGYELSLSGTKISGLGITIKSRVGMVSNPLELVGENSGSGYDVFNPATGEKYDGYTGSEVTVEGLSFGDLSLDSTSTFDFENGWKSTVFSFELDEFSPLVEVDGSVSFSPQSKSVTLTPKLDLGWSCIDLYTELRPVSLTGEEDTLTDLRVHGFGVDELAVGSVTVSAKIGLGSNHLYLRKSEYDYTSRASDYVFSPSPQEEAYYKEKPYEGVISLERGVGNLFIAADGYLSEGANYLGLGLVTGEMEYKFSEGFEVSGGVDLKSDLGLERIFVTTTYSW